MNYQKILILEDDFVCSPELKNKEHINNIEIFTKKKNKSIFSFGVLPIITTYHSNFFRRSWISTGTHATLFPNFFFKKIIDNEHNICDIDVYLHLISKRYIYYKPLITQSFPVTDNFKTWGNSCIGKLGGIIFRFIISFLITIFELDKREEPGTTRIYLINKLLFDFIIPFLLLILFYIYYFRI